MTIEQLTQDFEARYVKLAEDAEVVLRRRVPSCLPGGVLLVQRSI